MIHDAVRRIRSRLGPLATSVTEGVSTRLLLFLVPTVFLAIVVFLPMVYFVWGSVWSTTPGFGGQFTLDGYRQVVTSAGVRATLANTLVLAVVGTTVAVVVGLLTIVVTLKMAVSDRVRTFVSAVLIVQLLLPTFIQGLAWQFYLGPTGPINRLLMLVPFVTSPVVSPHNIWTIAFIFGTHYAGLVYLLTNGAVSAIPPDVEEVGLISGASEASVFARINLRLVWPTLVISIIIVLVRAVQSFGLPLVLGLPNRVFTLATLLYFELSDYPRDFTFIAALGIIILLLCLWLLLMQQRLSGARERYETITGSGESSGTLRYVERPWLARGFLAFVIFAYVLPFCMVAVGSVQETWVGLRPRFITWSLEGYRTLLVGRNAEVFYSSITNGLALGVGTATLALVLGIAISYLSLKTDWWASRIPDTLSFAPIAIPGIVLASALQWIILTYNDLLGFLYASLLILIVVYTGKFLLYGVRAANASLRSVGTNLEEAGHIAGADTATAVRQIYAPLMGPGLLSGFIIVFIDTTKSLSIPLILAGNEFNIVQTAIWFFIHDAEFNVAAAYTVLLVLALSLVYAVAYRYDVDLTKI